MAYDAHTLVLLLSSPADVTEADLQHVEQVVSVWNFQVGRTMHPRPLTILPIRWRTHAGAESGGRPQALLNNQLVDHADLAIALFWNRLGTPTGHAQSGSEEEIDRLLSAGKQVGILRCTRPATVTGSADTAEKARLEAWIEDRYKSALVSKYVDAAELGDQIRNMLSALADRIRRAKPDAVAVGSIEAGSGHVDERIWPRIETASGRTGREWYLVIDNPLNEPVHEVTIDLENEDGSRSNFAVRTIPEPAAFRMIPPRQSQRVKLLRAMGSDDEAICVLRWTDASGEQFENRVPIYSI